jgi:hypothetical protein
MKEIKKMKKKKKKREKLAKGEEICPRGRAVS